MSCFVGIIFEVLNTIILVGEEIVGYSDVESTCGVGNCKVELLCIIRIRDTVAAPCAYAKTIIANTESWLYASFTEFLTTPEIVAYNISSHVYLNFILCVCYAYAQHSCECKSHYLECSHNLFPFFCLCLCYVPAGCPAGTVVVLCVCMLLSSQDYFAIHSAMRRIASSQSSRLPNAVSRTYPSPEGPKPTPGVHTMLAP